MPTPWAKKARDAGKLYVFGGGDGWNAPLKAAITTFNAQKFGVALELIDDEKKTDIIVRVSKGPDSYDWPGNRKLYGLTTKTRPTFAPDKLHGQTNTIADPAVNEIVFAVVFLPGRITDPTDRQKEVVIVHEFLHACGLDGGRGGGAKPDPGMDHDIVGIMVGQMTPNGTGLLETFPEKGATVMTPIRVGAQTLCKMKLLWAGGKECKN